MFDLFGFTAPVKSMEKRSVGSIEDALIKSMAAGAHITGETQQTDAAIRLTREQYKSPEFAKALKLVAETVLGLFPNHR